MSLLTDEQKLLVFRVENSLPEPGDAKAIGELIRDLVTMADCDCVDVKISSKACQKCGKPGTITNEEAQGHFVELTNLDYLLGRHIEYLEIRGDPYEADRLQEIRGEARRIGRDHRNNLKDKGTPA